MTDPAAAFSRRHLLGIEGLTRPEIESLLDLADEAVSISRQVEKKRDDLARPHADQPVLRGLHPHAPRSNSRASAWAPT